MPRPRCSGRRGIWGSERSASSTARSRAAAAIASTWRSCDVEPRIRARSANDSQVCRDRGLCTEARIGRRDDGRIRQNGRMTDDARHLLVVAHTGRADSLEAGIHVCRSLIDAGITPVVSDDELADLRAADPQLAPLALLGTDVAAKDLELVIVVGGDGTILRA